MDKPFQLQLLGLKTDLAIECAVRDLCERYGGIKDLKIVTDYESGDKTCYLALAVAENQTRLFSVLNGIHFGNSFVFKIPAMKGMQ